MSRARLLASALTVTAVLVACTGGGGDGSSSGLTSSSSTTSSTGGTQATPQAIATLSFAGTSCPTTGLPSVGTFGPPAQPILDGNTWEEKPVAISCLTYPASGKFVVSGYATYGVESDLKIDGTVSETGPQTIGIAVTNGGKVYTSSACNLTYPAGGGVAAGRFWGSITCADTFVSNQSTGCALAAEIRFENCKQQP